MSISKMRGGTRFSSLAILWLGALVPLGAVGCGSEGSSRGTSAGAAGNASAGAGGDAGADATDAGSGGGSAGDPSAAGSAGEAGDAGSSSVLERPWNEQSQHVELNCFAYFSGSMRFSADRAQLSEQQIQLLAGLRPAPANDQCWEDELGCQLAITSEGGEVIEYTADEKDALCNRSPALAFASVSPLLDSLGCKYAKEDASALSASSGCFHGFFASGSAVIEQQLALSEAHRTYHVELDRCSSSTRAGRVTLELRGADPDVPLAVGLPVAEPGPNGTCLAFELEVQTPVTATLVITTTESFGPGDFYLNFR
jgi:hypothetical protein